LSVMLLGTLTGSFKFHNMEKALMIIGNNPEEIARALVQFAESYSEARPKERQTMPAESERMNSRQAAKFAGVSQATFNKWVKAGRINYYGSNKVRFFYKSEVIEAIKKMN